MAFPDPRGSVPYSDIQISSLSKLIGERRRLTKQSSSQHIEKPKSSVCMDWVFSAATNVHVAINRAAFKTFQPFQTFALAVSDQRRIPVEGIGEVELKIRCKPSSKESRTICLYPVLYIPSWYCNIVSDVHFMPDLEFDHQWSENGLKIRMKQNGKFKPWGYTEQFCGMDRLVLASNQHGRSPMLEDTQREIWSVNLYWPESQRSKWSALGEEKVPSSITKEIMDKLRTEDYLLQEPAARLWKKQDQFQQANSAEHKRLSRSQSSPHFSNQINQRINAMSKDLEQSGQRISLNEISNNVVVSKGPKIRVRRLRATLSKRSLIKEVFQSPKKHYL